VPLFKLFVEYDRHLARLTAGHKRIRFVRLLKRESVGNEVLSQLVCISISHLPRRCCNEEGETVTEGRNSGLRTYFAGRASRCLPQSTQCGTLRHLRPAKDLVEKIASRFEPRKTFTDYDAMLADPKVEAVVVAIADQFHVDAAIRAFESR
jgi:Oxidoreductase family, NAD-binding Rossmann fold